MSRYLATIEWKRSDEAVFTDGRYNRAHLWMFDGGAVVPASSSPHTVPAPLSDPASVDPEEAFVAALSSCHMLFYLSIAAKRGFVINNYRDEAEGMLQQNAGGETAMTHVVLKPRVSYAGTPPDRSTEEIMHHESHGLCFIANSVKTHVETQIQ